MQERFVGIDWGEKELDLEIQAPDGKVLCARSYGTKDEALLALRDRLLDGVESPEHVHVAIESCTERVVGVLLAAGIRVYALNPSQTKPLRRLYSIAQKKSDPFDAHILVDGLRTHREIFRLLQPLSTEIIALRLWVQGLEQTKARRIAAADQLRQHLRKFFPQVLELPWSSSTAVVHRILGSAASPGEAATVDADEMRKALGRARKCSPEEALEILQERNIELEPAVDNAVAQRTRQFVEELDMLGRHEGECEANLEQMLQRLAAIHDEDDTVDGPSDVEIIQSFPGIGIRITGRILGNGALAIAERNLDAFRRQATAPVSRQTGQQKHRGPRRIIVKRRLTISTSMQNAMHQMGDLVRQNTSYYGTMYADMRARGLSHGRACRQVADNVLTVMFAMLRDRTLYDPEKHGRTRRQKAA